ncbi:MAG: DUF1501 domain-containing protein [Pirellulales bacterium]|nr:DUF1501 domain-containing protein [Pirellulales bacterium]
MLLPRAMACSSPPHPRGVSRRELLEIGCSSLLGLGLPALAPASPVCAATAEAASTKHRAKSVLFVFLFGGPSQLDTFDPKPDAPIEYRGSHFGTIGTALPGVRFCEHLPELSARTSRFALVRTMACNPNFGDHRFAVHGLLGGIDELPAGAGLPATRRDWPCWGSVVEYVRPRSAGLPNCIVLPGLVVDPGTGTYPGQNAGLLGAKYDPFRIDQNPNSDQYRVDGSLSMPQGMSLARLAEKRELLAALDRGQAALEAGLEVAPYSAQQREAFGVLSSGRLGAALDIAAEPAEMRDRYGRHLFGQSLLLARRLIQAGIPLVQANVSYQALWDTHYNNFVGLRGLLPPFDRAVSALLDDMHALGLLDETLVVVMGEFGRTPKLVLPRPSDPSHFTSPGRDHWMNCFWAMFAGAGVHGGQVIGRSDAVAAYPLTRAFTHADVGATVYRALGIDPRREIHDLQGRTLVLNHGAPMDALYSAADV